MRLVNLGLSQLAVLASTCFLPQSAAYASQPVWQPAILADFSCTSTADSAQTSDLEISFGGRLAITPQGTSGLSFVTEVTRGQSLMASIARTEFTVQVKETSTGKIISQRRLAVGGMGQQAAQLVVAEMSLTRMAFDPFASTFRMVDQASDVEATEHGQDAMAYHFAVLNMPGAYANLYQVTLNPKDFDIASLNDSYLRLDVGCRTKFLN